MRKLKLLQKFEQLPFGLKLSFAFAMCNIMQKAIQFITTPLFTRILSTSEYGQFTLYSSWYGIISIFATLNLSYGVLNNALVKYEEDRDVYISSMQGLTVVSSILTFAVLLSLESILGNFTGQPQIVFLVMFLQCIFTPSTSFWSTRERFENRYKGLVIVTILITVLTTLFSLFYVIISNQKGIARITSSAVISIIVGIIFFIYQMKKGKVFYHAKYWSFALKFNLPLIPHYLSLIVLGQADRIMIGNYEGETQVAIYGLTYSLSLVMSIVTQSINSSFIPWTYQECKKRNYQRIGEVSNGILFAVAVLSLMPVLLAPELMAILGPKEYAEGAYLVAPISTSVFFTFLYSLFGNIEFYFEKSKFVMIASVLGAVLNIILNAICIPLFGYQAAAYTTLVCYIAFSVTHYLFMKKTCKEQGITEPIYDVKKIIILGLFLLIVAHGIMLTYSYLIVRVALIAVIGLLVYKNRKKLLKEFLVLKQKD